jgi:hypothetical protein
MQIATRTRLGKTLRRPLLLPWQRLFSADTRFDDTPIESRHPVPARRRMYLPIQPAIHPDTKLALIIAHGKAMKKRSYVNTKDVYELPFAILRQCWHDSDLHLDEKSYKTLVTRLWKQNVAERVTRLKGHGIFERASRSAHIETPVRISEHCANRPRYSASYIRESDSPSTSALYGTFAAGSATLTHPHTLLNNVSSNVRQYSYPPMVSGRYQATPPPLDTISLPRACSTAEQVSTGQLSSQGDDNYTRGFGWLVIIVILIAICSWLHKG